jgi:hypothetical protein
VGAAALGGRGAGDAAVARGAPSVAHDPALSRAAPARRHRDGGLDALLRDAGGVARGLLGGDRAPPRRQARAGAGVGRAAAADLGPPDLLPLARRALAELVDVCDRLVVDSAEWRGLPEAYERLADLFDRIAVSDIAWGRARDWRGRIADLWPGVAKAERIAVTGPRADALLLAGWLRSRLRRKVELEHRSAKELTRVALDGAAVVPPLGVERTASDLLSDELDVFGRDPVYEAAVQAA